MSEIRIQENKQGICVYLQDLEIGAGRTNDKALGDAQRTLENYVATCEEGLELLEDQRQYGLTSDTRGLLIGSPLSLVIVGDAFEVRDRRKQLYSFGRCQGKTVYSAKQALESALRLTQTALDDVRAHLSA